MKKVYNCFRCGKWFEKAKVVDRGRVGEAEVCPFCGQRVYQTGGDHEGLSLPMVVAKGIIFEWW